MEPGPLDWGRVLKFSRDEFPEDPDRHAEPALIYALDAFRVLLGARVSPSRAAGALARFDAGAMRSRHYAGEGRRSDAVDLFPDCPAYHALAVALSMPCWGGIGLYFDTRDNRGLAHYMMHLDLRPIAPGERRVLWYRIEQRYTYPASPAQLITMFRLAHQGGP